MMTTYLEVLGDGNECSKSKRIEFLEVGRWNKISGMVKSLPSGSFQETHSLRRQLAMVKSGAMV